MRQTVKLAVIASVLLLSGGVSVYAADEELVEEVIVTGSYIRRDNFEIPSPIAVVTELDLELAGTADLGDVIFDQTFQYGVNANATPFEGNRADDQQWNQGQEVWANLRGLGTRATMTMMDGHRLPADTNTWGRRAGVDLNGTYPSIAIGRVETILDGASALYGAEAVGGVINIIPKKDFEGLEISYDIQEALDGGSPVTNLSLLAGIQGERGGAIFAVELRDQERMRYTERPEFIMSALDPWNGVVYTPWWHDAGSRSTPGDFQVPYRGADGNLIPVGSDTVSPVGHAATGPVFSTLKRDPGCAYGFGAGHDDMGQVPAELSAMTYNERVRATPFTYNDLRKPGSFLNGTVHATNGQCIMALADFQDMQAEASNKKAMAHFHYEFNEYIKLRGEVVISTNDYNTRDVTGGIDEIDTNELLGPFSAVVIGHNPGNPYRAFADGSASPGFVPRAGNATLDWDDVNGNGLYEYGVEPGEYYLFAIDSDGDGRPDRDYNGDGIADLNAQNDVKAQVVLFGLGDTDGDGIPDRFDQDWALANGGVRLFEDVRIDENNQLNVNPKNARNNTVDFLHEEAGALFYKRRFIRDNTRIRLGSEINIPDTEWIVDLDYVWTKGQRTNDYPEPLLSEFIKSLRCEGGSDTSGRAGGTYQYAGNGSCWNPFSTTYLNTTVDGQLIGDPSVKFPGPDDGGWRPFYSDSNGDGVRNELDEISPAVNTELENRNAGIVMDYQLQDLYMQLFDATVSTGSLFTLPWNDQPVGFAFGIHHRVETEEFKPSMVNQAATGGGKRGLRESEQTTNAVYAELSLPLIESDTWGTAELQLAARYAEIETKGIVGQVGKVKFDTTIPKIAFRWAPTDWVAVRASKTEGFVTPGLYAIFGTPLQYSGPGTNGGGRESVRDYICDNLPEIPDCTNTNQGGSISDILAGSTPNRDLGAETSDLYNYGLSLRLLDGDLSLDADFTHVEFKGRAEQIGSSVNVGANEVGFEDYVLGRCPGTAIDWDSADDLPPIANPSDYEALLDEYRANTPQAELDCRLNAAIAWVTTDANQGAGERSIGGSALLRGAGPNELGLTVAESPWLQQGIQTTESLIYAATYRFDADQIPGVSGDWGSFVANLSATQMLETSLQRYTSLGCPDNLRNTVTGLCPGDHPYAGIEIDGVGNRNSTQGFIGPGEDLYLPLAPTPEWRVNVGLRWFRGNHTAQIQGKWHDSITNLNVAWDPLKARGLLSAANALIPQAERCDQAPTWVCGFPAEMYWDVSYTYDKPDFMGMGFDLNVNVAIRNLFDNLPDPRLAPSGHEGYMDNIMGRMGFLRLTASL